MDIKILFSWWGYRGAQSEAALIERAQEAGYDGIEGEPPLCSPAEWQKLRAESGIANYILVGDRDLDEHVRKWELAASYAPDGIISHTASDEFSFDDGCRFIERCLKEEQRLGLPVVHELHRGKLFYHPVVTAQYALKFPELKFNADFSHFVNVCENLLQRVPHEMDIIINQSHHIHMRIGHEQGPQVSDPRAPEFRPHLEAHEDWWDRIKAAREKDGTKVLHVAPEFGPFPYMPALPYTRQPIADLWDVNLWMAQRTRQRWGGPAPCNECDEQLLG